MLIPHRKNYQYDIIHLNVNCARLSLIDFHPDLTRLPTPQDKLLRKCYFSVVYENFNNYSSSSWKRSALSWQRPTEKRSRLEPKENRKRMKGLTFGWFFLRLLPFCKNNGPLDPHSTRHYAYFNYLNTAPGQIQKRKEIKWQKSTPLRVPSTHTTMHTRSAKKRSERKYSCILMKARRRKKRGPLSKRNPFCERKFTYRRKPRRRGCLKTCKETTINFDQFIRCLKKRLDNALLVFLMLREEHLLLFEKDERCFVDWLLCNVSESGASFLKLAWNE